MNGYLAIGLIIASFFFGYWFCYQRHYVPQMFAMIKVFNNYLGGSISAEEMKKQIDEIKID